LLSFRRSRCCYVENIGEDQLDRLKNYRSFRRIHGKTETTIICGKLEAEMAELAPDS
jgi:hypothetical protein